MIDNNVEDGLNRIMFPVGEVPVYAETEPGRRERIPRKKALINDDTRRVLSIVSDRYKLLHNSKALELARMCCINAFPNTAPANWQVFRVEAPLTGGHCHIDLMHEGKVSGYDWAFTGDEQDEFAPFIRVSNSYNKTNAFAICFGFVRWACTNGMIDWASSITIKVAHDEREMEKSIEAKINEAKFRKVFRDFQSVLKPLHDAHVPRDYFRPLMLSVLNIQKPGNLPEDREDDWECLMRNLDRIASRYVDEMGQTGYALLNAITDVSSQPPKISGYNFIHRERHGLQRLAGIWLFNFSKIARQPQALKSYLAKPSRETLCPADS